MKILFLDQYAEPGGAQLCLRDVADAARARGWDSWLLVPDRGLPASIARYASGRKTPGDIAAFGYDMIRGASAIRRLIREHRIDLVYANGPRVLPAAALAGAPLVFHIHSYLAQKSARAIVNLSLRFTPTMVLAASRFVADPIIKMRRGPVRVIYNGVAEQAFRPRSFTSPTLTVGILGRIAREKGHLDFAVAARAIAKAYPGTRFVVYGDPLFSGREYEKEVRAAAAGLNFEFKGWADNVAEALHAIDILAVPSAPVDSLPRVIPEALSAGTPVVAYPSGGIPELMRSRENCLLTELRTAGSLSRAICALIGDRDLMRWLALNGRIDWERQFQLPRFQQDICDALEQFFEATVSSTRSPASQSHRAPLRARVPTLRR